MGSFLESWVENGNIRELAALLSMVQTIPHHEPILDGEPHVLDDHRGCPPGPLVQQ